MDDSPGELIRSLFVGVALLSTQLQYWRERGELMLSVSKSASRGELRTMMQMEET